MKYKYFLLPFFIFFLTPFSAYASVELSNPDYSDASNQGNYMYIQRLGTGLDFTIESLSQYIKPPSSSCIGGNCTGLNVLINAYSDSAYTVVVESCFSSDSIDIVPGTSKALYTWTQWDTTGACTFKPTYYYEFRLVIAGSYPWFGFEPNRPYNYGSNTNSFNSETCLYCNNLASVGFSITSLTTLTTTRIDLINPQNGTSTPSRTINIDFDYYLNSITHATSTYTNIYFDFISQAYPNDAIERVEFNNLTPDSLTTIATSTTLNRDGYYLGLIYFTNGINKVSSTQSTKFNSATTTIIADIPFSNPLTICSSLGGTFDTALCKSMMFLFYPSDSALTKFNSISDIFQDKVPFAYYYLFKNKLESFVLASTTAPVLSFNFGTTTSPAINGTITIFDMGDIDTNFDFSVAWLWIIRFMWITFGVYVVARVLKVASVI